MQQCVITLLRSAITGEKLPLPEGFDLEAVYPELKKHNMDTLLYEGAVRCGISKQLPVMQQLFGRYCRYLMVAEGQQRRIREIFAAFEENGIEYLPLKGCHMRSLYPKPELRYMGDADVLIRLEQYNKIKPVMEGLGFEEKGGSDHELPWNHPELHVELHKRLIPSYNGDFFDYFGSGWQKAARRNGCCWTMTAEDEWIFLFTHFAKHFRDGGIGCRYVLDLWVYLKHNPGLDGEYIRGALEKLQLWEFHENIRNLIDVWFGDAHSDGKLDAITDYIFASGSWGEALSRTVSVAVRDSRRDEDVATGKIQYALRVMFPSADTLKDKYTILKKWPWMLPLVWLIRPFYKFLWERKSMMRHQKHLDAITDENVEQRRKLLRYFGIEYRF